MRLEYESSAVVGVNLRTAKARLATFYIGLAIADTALILISLWVDRHQIRVSGNLIYLLVATATLSLVSTSLPVGRLNLASIALGSGICILPPALCAVVAAPLIVSTAVSSHWKSKPLQLTGPMFWTLTGAWVKAFAATVFPLWVADLVGLAALSLANLIGTTLAVRMGTGARLLQLWRQALDRSLFAAFVYFALSAFLMANLLNGTVRGYLLASIVGLLGLALADTLATRKERAQLQEHLSSTERYLIQVRLREESAHNLRNHLAVARAYLRELPGESMDEGTRADLHTAQEAVDEALESIDRLNRPTQLKEVTLMTEIDLDRLAADVVTVLRRQALNASVRLELHSHRMAAPVALKGDPGMLREALAVLVTNAIEAQPDGGVVVISTGLRNNDHAYLRVSDRGPGVPDELVPRLFEPHFTTKPNGSGIGLFGAYGIVREHRGMLLYEGSANHGAVFTILLPIKKSV